MNANQILKLVSTAAANGCSCDHAVKLGTEIARRRDAKQSIDCDAYRALMSYDPRSSNYSGSKAIG